MVKLCSKYRYAVCCRYHAGSVIVFLSFDYRASSIIFSIIVPQNISAMERCVNRVCVLLEYMYVIVFYVSWREIKSFAQLHVLDVLTPFSAVVKKE